MDQLIYLFFLCTRGYNSKYNLIRITQHDQLIIHFLLSFFCFCKFLLMVWVESTCLKCFFCVSSALFIFYCLQSTVIKCLLNFIYWTPQLPAGGDIFLILALVWFAQVVVRGLTTDNLILKRCRLLWSHLGVVETARHSLEYSCNFILNSL